MAVNYMRRRGFGMDEDVYPYLGEQQEDPFAQPEPMAAYSPPPAPMPAGAPMPPPPPAPMPVPPPPPPSPRPAASPLPVPPPPAPIAPPSKPTAAEAYNQALSQGPPKPKAWQLAVAAGLGGAAGYMNANPRNRPIDVSGATEAVTGRAGYNRNLARMKEAAGIERQAGLDKRATEAHEADVAYKRAVTDKTKLPPPPQRPTVTKPGDVAIGPDGKPLYTNPNQPQSRKSPIEVELTNGKRVVGLRDSISGEITGADGRAIPLAEIRGVGGRGQQSRKSPIEVEMKDGTRVVGLQDSVSGEISAPDGSVIPLEKIRRMNPGRDPQPNQRYQSYKGGLSPEEFARVNTISDDARQDKDLKIFVDVRDSYQRIVEAAKRGDGVGDLTLLRSFAKLTDPTTGVREEEYRTMQVAQGALTKLGVNLTRGMFHGEQLTPEGRKRFLEQSQQLYRKHEQNARKAAKYYQDRAKEAGVNPASVLSGIYADDATGAAPDSGGQVESWDRGPDGKLRRVTR